MSAFGAPGIVKMIRILKDELEMTMRLMGTPTVADIRAEMVVTTDLGRHTVVPRDWLQQETYLPKASQAANQKFRGRRRQNARVENYVQSSKDALALGGSGGSSEVAALREEVRELKAMLAGVATAVKQINNNSGGGSSSGQPSTFSLATAAVLLFSTLLGLARTIFVLDSRMSVHRTALFLIAYLVVHVSGTLLVFSGADRFNAYANGIASSRVVKVVELYLLLAVVLHVAMALYRAYKTKVLKGATTAPVSVFKRLYLMLTGLTILAFLGMHVTHFRFNAAGKAEYALADGAGTDYFRLVTETLGDDAVALGYVAGVLAVGLHLYFGWTKAVHKMNLDTAHGTAEYLHPVRKLGYALAFGVTAGFVASVLGARALGNN